MSGKGSYVSIDQFLNDSRVALDNAQNMPEITSALGVFGYDAVRLQEGAALLGTAESLQATQVREYGEQYQATAAVTQTRQDAEARYTVHRKLARIALKNDPERQKALLLHEGRKRSISGWLRQAEVFYTNALADPDVVAALARFGVTQADLESTQIAVAEVAALDSTQEKEKAEAQRATKARDAALDALADWMADFRGVARIALANDSQLLEALLFGAIE